MTNKNREKIIKYFNEIGAKIYYSKGNTFFCEYSFPHSGESYFSLKIVNNKAVFRGGTTTEYFHKFGYTFPNNQVQDNFKIFTKYKIETFGGGLSNARPEGGDEFGGKGVSCVK